MALAMPRCRCCEKHAPIAELRHQIEGGSTKKSGGVLCRRAAPGYEYVICTRVKNHVGAHHAHLDGHNGVITCFQVWNDDTP